MERPLDSRKDYTKSDWILWVSSLTKEKKKSKMFIDGLERFLKTSPDRVPFSDWFESKDGKFHYFRARSV